MHGAIQKGYIYTIQIANEWTEMVEIYSPLISDF